MDELLSDPAVQAGVAPFLAGLLAAALLYRTRWTGLVIVVAFATAVGLTLGFSFESLTSVRKLMLAGMGSAVVVAVLELMRIAPTQKVRGALAACMALASVWVVWRVLPQQSGAKVFLCGMAAALYGALLLDFSLRAARDAATGAASSVILGLAMGALAILGASASLGQLGVAIAAGAGAVLLVQLVLGRRAQAGWTAPLPGAVIGALVGLLAVLTGSLPWFCLLPTLAIPWAARLFVPGRRGSWFRAAGTALVGVVPAGVAIGLAWYTGG